MSIPGYEPAPLPDDRETAALALLGRIHRGESNGRPLHDADMEAGWIEEEIAAFIAKFGPLPEASR